MKKIYSKMMMLAIMVATLGFVSCSDDDDDPKVPSLVGSWECTKVIPANNLLDEVYDFEMTAVINFAPNGKYIRSGDTPDNGTWSLKGLELSLRSSDTDWIGVYVIEQIDANVLVIKDEFAKFEFTKII